jgi:hypothetical protein
MSLWKLTVRETAPPQVIKFSSTSIYTVSKNIFPNFSTKVSKSKLTSSSGDFYPLPLFNLLDALKTSQLPGFPDHLRHRMTKGLTLGC